MIGKVWTSLVMGAVMLGMAGGKAGESMQAIMDSAPGAVRLMLELLGTMTLWSGLMEMLEASGDLARLGRGLRRLMGKLFPKVCSEEAWSAAGMNLAADLLGLGNAATPAGIRAAQLLAGQGEQGLRALAFLLALNNSGLQLMPTTVIALRSAAGAAHPGDIWLPSLLSSGAATLTAVVLMLVWNRRARRNDR